MTHPPDETLAQLAHGRLTGAELEAAEAHVDGCAACRTLLAAVSNGSAPLVAPERVALPVGERLGRYEIESLIGAGGMGMLYAARDTQLNRRVVLKLMRPAFEGELGRVRLLREAQAMALLPHPNVVAVYELGESGERVFVAMELVDGGTLRDWMKAPGSWKDVVAMMVQAGRGLAAAHAAGVVHRDFKPENVLVGKDGRPRVGDFGLSRPELVAEEELPHNASMRVTRTGTMLGTPAYMSPEQLAGKPADARSDQYSFCVTLYEALTGKRPFPADTLEELRARVNGGMPPPPKDGPIPAAVWAVIARGLHPDPAQRFPSMDALLELLSAPMPVTATAATQRRRLSRTVLLGTLLTALGGGVATWVVRPHAPAAASSSTAVTLDGPPDPADRELNVGVGTQRVIDAAGLERFEVEDASIANVTTLGNDQLIIHGNNPGKTTLRTWTSDGKRHEYNVTVWSATETQAFLMRASGPPPVAGRELALDVGTIDSLDEPGIQRIAVGDESIAHATTVGLDTFLVIGQGAGQTTVMTWKSDGTRVEHKVTVRAPSTAPPEPAPQQAPAAADSQIAIEVGMQKVLDEPGIQRIAVGDASIADVKTIGDDQILVIGITPGSTTLLIWKKGGKRLNYTVTVRSPNGARPTELDVILGETRTVEVPRLRGMRPLTSAVARAQVDASGGRLTVTGLTEGTESLQLWDEDGAFFACRVEVAAPKGKADVTVFVGEDQKIVVPGAETPQHVRDETLVALRNLPDGLHIAGLSPGRTSVSIPTRDGLLLTYVVDVLRFELSEDEVRQFLLTHLDALEPCLRAVPKYETRGPYHQRTTLHWTVKPDGHTFGAGVDSNNPNWKTSAERCVVEQISKWTFPRSAHGRPGFSYTL